MTLSPRLKKIVDFTEKCGVVADIGTDHALVPVYLVENGTVERAYACDIRTQPLKRAEEYIASRNLSDKITAILSDGLQNVPDDAETIIIAGMGGEMIVDIISHNIVHSKAKYVLQPMTAIDLLREYLYKNGYVIRDEEIVSEHDGEKLYSVMKVEKVDFLMPYSELDVLLSPVLRNKNTAEKRLYIKKLIKIRTDILENMKKSPNINEDYKKRLLSEISLLKGCI
jgi:tRNA (adenine22-N1)-methyltransferase